MPTLADNMSAMTVSGLNSPRRTTSTTQPGAPQKKGKRPREYDEGFDERSYKRNKKFSDEMGAVTGTSMESGKTRRRRIRRSKRRKSRRKRKTKRKKRRKSRKRRKTRRRRRRKR